MRASDGYLPYYNGRPTAEDRHHGQEALARWWDIYGEVDEKTIQKGHDLIMRRMKPEQAKKWRRKNPLPGQAPPVTETRSPKKPKRQKPQKPDNRQPEVDTPSDFFDEF